MASRVYQVGTIVSRTNWLLQTGVLKQRPIWLDVVEAFPPDVFPKHNSTPDGGRAPEIVYQEDQLRRQFYEKYKVTNQSEDCLSLFEENPEGTTVCSRFVSEQMKRLSAGDDEAEAARKAQWELRNQGIDIRIKPSPQPKREEKTEERGSSTLNSLRALLEQMHSSSKARQK